MEERLKKIEKLREMRINPYPYHFDRTHTFEQVRNNFEKLSQSQEIIATCGRILAIRGHGKTVFATLSDEGAKIQIYLRKEDLAEKFDVFEHFDIGDFIGVKGKVFKTKTGETTVVVYEFIMLAKSLRPLPEKWHGLTDIEIRYRKRYLDLIANPEIRELFKGRTKLISLIRKFFDDHGFIEVETPILQSIYGGAAARPFKTYYNALAQEMFLRIADELYLKRLIVGGYERVYEVCRDFRNEGIDRFHNPEFTMIEAYQAYTDYERIMGLVESLIEFLIADLHRSGILEYGDKKIEVKKPFKRIQYVDVLNEKLGFDILSSREDDLDKACKAWKIDYEKLTLGAKIDKLFNEIIRKDLVEPTFAIDYPKIISPLAKTHRNDNRLVERFQFFMFGFELANAFTELNDPAEQRKRFEMQLAQKEEGIGQIDEDFIEALDYGMPPTGGLGIGIDRLCMVMFNQPSIRDVILFPQLRKEI